jgi:hypothetical protein
MENYNFSCVLLGCDTWPLILREGHRVMMFENMVLGNIFGSKRHAVSKKWRQCNEKLYDLYFSPNVIR